MNDPVKKLIDGGLTGPTAQHLIDAMTDGERQEVGHHEGRALKRFIKNAAYEKHIARKTQVTEKEATTKQ